MASLSLCLLIVQQRFSLNVIFKGKTDKAESAQNPSPVMEKEIQADKPMKQTRRNESDNGYFPRIEKNVKFWGNSGYAAMLVFEAGLKKTKPGFPESASADYSRKRSSSVITCGKMPLYSFLFRP